MGCCAAGLDEPFELADCWINGCNRLVAAFGFSSTPMEPSDPAAQARNPRCGIHPIGGNGIEFQSSSCEPKVSNHDHHHGMSTNGCPTCAACTADCWCSGSSNLRACYSF